MSAEGGVRSFDKSDIVEKKYSKKSIFCKTFFCFSSIYLVLKSILSKLLTTLSAEKKNSFLTKRLYTNDALSSILFQPITARLFPIAALVFALSILAIPLDMCQMKSFENINILIKVKLFCLKNLFL